MKLPSKRSTPMRRNVAAGLLAAGAGLLAAQPALAAAPAAGAIVGNQASATYTDGSNESRLATSNLVETVVKQISGVDIEANQDKFVSVGGTVYFPHTVENTGNGADSYSLAGLTDDNTGNINFNSLVVYADADLDGIPDDFNPITSTPTLAAGETFGVVIAGQVPTTVSAGDTEEVTLIARSVFNTADFDSNTDSVTVTSNAVIEMTKAMSSSTGPSPSSGPIKVTLTYTNTGNDTATSVHLLDTLPAGMSYVDDTGRWSGSTGTILGDASGPANDPSGIDYIGLPNSIEATLTNLAPGESGTLTFDVVVDGSLAPGDIDNIARYDYNDGAAAVAPVDTNTATYTVQQSAGVVATDSQGTIIVSASDDDGSSNDVVTEATAAEQGGSVAFSNIIKNAGNGTDTFELSLDLAAISFPAGTSFLIYQADGVTPLTDTNGDGVPDTGPLDPAGEKEVVVVATLPIGASGDNGGAGFDLVMTATSALDGSSDPVTDHLNSITASTVDLTNNLPLSGGAAAGEGTGAGPEAAPVTTNSTDPGLTTSFDLFINNTSGVADSYDLAVSTVADLSTLSLPAGWTVQFSDSAGNIITNSGVIPAGGEMAVTASVSIPDGEVPGTTDLFFRTLSATTGAEDTKRDAVTVQTVRAIELSQSGAGQAFPGGSQVYPHILVNNGNVAETAGALISTDDSSADGWASIIYFDANNNGLIDPSEVVVDDIADFGGVPAGDSIPLLVKVLAPAGANPGDSNTTTLSASYDNGTAVISDSTQDVTTVVTGDVVLDKAQALDTDCNGVVEGSYVPTVLAAEPGQCVAYRIIATNTGSALVTGLTINDATPNFTSFTNCAGTCVATAVDGSGVAQVPTTPATGSTGTVNFTAAELKPTETARLDFTVQLNQ